MQNLTEIPPQNAPFFSIIILEWNSASFMQKCLDALVHQTEKDFEIILVDNGSPDPVSQDVLRLYTQLNINHHRLEKNIGFAAGNNYAAKFARGQYLVLLNSDAFPQADWLAVLRCAIQSHPNCSLASRLIIADAPDRLDGEGDNYHATGIVWRKSFGRRVTRAFEHEKEVFSACGAAAVYPRPAFEEVNGFDDDYFAYSEDVDLGFRLRLSGIACFYIPSAVVFHMGSGSTSQRSDFSVYYGQRNLVWTFFKNMPGVLLFILIPFHILMNLSMILLSCFRKQGRLTLKAKVDAFASLDKIMAKRNAIQSHRSASIVELVRIIDWNPFSPILKLLNK